MSTMSRHLKKLVVKNRVETQSQTPIVAVANLTETSTINPAAPMPEVTVPRVISLWCLVDTDTTPFEVDVPVDFKVNRLKELIKEKGVDIPFAKDLVLWKLNLDVAEPIGPDNTLATRIQSRGTDISKFTMRLSSEMKLSAILRQLPPEDCLHIIVQLPTVPTTKRTRSPSPDLANKRQFLAENTPSIAPSTGAEPSEFFKHQKPERAWLYCNLPPTVECFPTTLVSDILAKFVDDCMNHNPEAIDNRLALELKLVMSNYYRTEASRAAKFRQAVLNCYGIDLQAAAIGESGFHSDGHVMEGPFVCVLLEAKNYTAATKAFIQAGLYYRQLTQQVLTAVQHSPLPCLIMYYFGPYLGFAGIVSRASAVHYEVLTPIIPLLWQSHNVHMHAMTARYLGAFRLAATRLKNYYKSLSQLRFHDFHDHDPDFPYIRAYRCLPGPEIRFKYKCQLYPRTPIFLVEREADHQPMCVKFVRRYSEALHRHCAAKGMAPTLHACFSIAGGWTVIVMEMIKEPYRLYSQICCDQNQDTPNATQLRCVFEELLQGLNDANLIHGDLRDVNMFVRTDGCNEHLVKIVDFDWGGIAGEVRYPVNVSRTNIWRPDGVDDGRLIMHNHDKQMLYKLLE